MQTHSHTHLKRTLLFNAAYVTLLCKYCKTEKYLLEAKFKYIWSFFVSGSNCVYILSECVCVVPTVYISVCIRVFFGFSELGVFV